MMIFVTGLSSDSCLRPTGRLLGESVVLGICGGVAFLWFVRRISGGMLKGAPLPFLELQAHPAQSGGTCRWASFASSVRNADHEPLTASRHVVAVSLWFFLFERQGRDCGVGRAWVFTRA